MGIKKKGLRFQGLYIFKKDYGYATKTNLSPSYPKEFIKKHYLPNEKFNDPDF
jgi:hypothetical protein